MPNASSQSSVPLNAPARKRFDTRQHETVTAAPHPGWGLQWFGNEEVTLFSAAEKSDVWFLFTSPSL